MKLTTPIKMRHIYRIILVLIFLGSIKTVRAQNVPPPATPPPQSTTNPATTNPATTNPTTVNPATVKPGQISDNDLRDMVQKAKDAGLSDDQIKQQAIQKGMSESDINTLQNRINIIRTSQDANQDANAATKKTQDGRQAIEGDLKNNKTFAAKTGDGGLSIFGSELFNNPNLTFEPNLRIPTPKNYHLGPDDQLVINVFGNSQVEWKPSISPEGNIQIPGVGLVYISGKTIEQATEIIKSKLIQNHYAIGHGTNLEVNIGNIRSIKVILIGEIAMPGTYTLSSLATVFNALYSSGGPTANGSFRKIDVIRNNAVTRTLDVYDFLLTGSKKDDIKLEDGDIIRVPTYKVHVSLTGQVKRPAIYEVLPGETLGDVIKFSGGFTDLALTSTIKAIQLTDQDRRVKEIPAADFNNYVPLRGDLYIVDKILDTYENRVSIYGAVVRPGPYELEPGLTLTKLIKKAAGLKADAFPSRGFISRLESDGTTGLVSFDVKGVVNKTSPDIALKKEDVVSIASTPDLHDEYTVTINGDVRHSGIFAYADSIRVEDLIAQAGGFSESASAKRIEIARRINYGDPAKLNSPVSKIFIVNVDEHLKLSDSSFVLQPFDIVSVYNSPGYETQKGVQVLGEVFYAGPYTIEFKNERISDLIKKAGGLTASADISEAVFRRTADKLAPNKGLVAVDFREILDHPGSDNDIRLEEGDVLFIPKQQQLVKINGEVTYPSSVVYNGSGSFTKYVSNAGGFTLNALRRKAYVVYANGRVKGTHSFLFVKFYPKVTAGSMVVIPTKPPHDPITPAAIGSIASGLLSAAAVLIGIISITK